MTDAGNGSRAADPDGIVVALSSIALGALGGGAIMSAGTLALRSLVADAAGPDSAGFIVLTAAVALGFGAAVVIAFGASRPVDNLWRRGVIGAIAFFGAAVLSVLAAPIDMFAGRPGLLVWIALLAAAWTAALRVRRSAA